VDGSYDDAITRSAREAAADCLVISDTSWDGYTETPADVIRGYSTMFVEIDQALAGHSRPTPDVVGLQAGVGSFAAAGLGHYCPPGGGPRPRTVVVEPESANCLMRSAQAGAIRAAPGPHGSAMAGLNCGLPSQLAWPVVANSTDAYVAIGDEPMYAAMRLLAGIGIVAGESGASSLGGLLAVTDDAGRAKLGLHAGATVLLVNTEGATDPANYREHVGEDPADVAQQAAARRAKARVAAL
jgi:diaminopropionate ammonia-lyase